VRLEKAAADIQETCRYLLNNLDWLDEELGSYEDDYLIIDCPGQSHASVPPLSC
jgi:MinD-like ATPase involved in chromosome partitioning or flagellar assembly